MSLDHLKKTPAPAPMWVAIFREAAVDELLDRETPTKRAVLVAGRILEDSPSPSRATFVHRLAVALDREPLRLYELERRVSPEGPVEQIEADLARRVERAMKGLS